MQSDIVDKLLIMLLILTLPLSILIASNYQKKMDTIEQEKIKKEQMAKIEQAVNEAKAEQKSAIKKIDIEQVYFATESSKLVITGKAPKKDTTMMVAAVLTAPGASKSKDASASAQDKQVANVLGEAVDVVAIKSDIDGEFAYVKKIDPKETEIVEIRIDQDQSNVTIKYDIQKRRQITD